MYCKKCGKEISDDALICQFCGEKTHLNNEVKSENKKMSKKFIVLIILLVIVMLSTSFGALYFAWKIRSNNLNKINESVNLMQNENFAEIMGAVYVYGFTKMNNEALKDYCADAGYVPQKYLNTREKTFKNTELNAKNYIAENLFKYDKKLAEQYLNTKIEESKPKVFETFDNEYNSMKQENQNMSKIDYCKYFDENTDLIIQNHLQALNDQMPSWYIK